nr:hypothetical protein [Elusimicrobiota bacterium]
FKERRKDRTEENMFLILFIGSVIFPYIFVNSHRMRYMVPALPAVAALIILNFYGDKKFFRFVFKATGILTGIASGILLIVIFKMKIINIPLLLIGFLISAATVLFLLKRKLHYTAVTILVFNLFFLGFIYSGMGLWKVPDNIIKKLKDSDFSTLNRRPFFLPVRAGRVSFNDVTGVKSFKMAVEAGSLIYFPRHRMKKFKKLMDASGYNDYENYIVWERFNEVPKKPDIIKAFKTGDINFLKEKTYFIKVK